MFLMVMMLTGCNRLWYDSAEADLGSLNLKPGIVRVEGDGYRMDPDAHIRIDGRVWIEGLGDEQQWKQLNMELAWTVYSAAEGDVPRNYGISLWNLDELIEGGDGELLAPTALLNTIQIDAHQPVNNVLLTGAIAAPEGVTEYDFALGLMVEDLSNHDGNYAISGGASLLMSVNGYAGGSPDQPLMGLTIDGTEGGDTTTTGSTTASGE